MFPTLIRRAAQEARPVAQTAYLRQIRELYPPKKVWPPDFKKLSRQEQLKFEKKYKRRLALATARPRWDKAVKLVQLFSVVSVLVYTVMFMDWKNERQPFDVVRESFWSFLGLDYDGPSARPLRKSPPEGLPEAK